jgi:hypothetical protein
MTKLLEKDVKFDWSQQSEDIFLTLKKLLTTTTVLAQPNIEKSFDVYCDASGIGIGGVLMRMVMLSPVLHVNLDVMKSTIQLMI